MHNFAGRLVLLVSFWQLGGCCSPYECSAAVEGRSNYAPVIDALASYRNDHGNYPETLEELIPAYASEIPTTSSVDSTGLEYFRMKDSYLFSFRYYGPGTNRCEYSPESEWVCDGAY